jgi:hypothetical protein
VFCVLLDAERLSLGVIEREGGGFSSARGLFDGQMMEALVMRVCTSGELIVEYVSFRPWRSLIPWYRLSGN